MIVQVEPKIDEIPEFPSQTEGHEGVVETGEVPETNSLTEEQGPPIAKGKTPTYTACDLRDKTPEVRAARVAKLREALNKIGDKPSGRAEAKRATLMYKLKILCK